MRDVTPAVLAALQAGTVRPVVFFEGQFHNDTVRTWTGERDVDWNGHTWLGRGGFISFGPVEETTGPESTGTSVTLSGVPIEYVTLALSENGARQGQPGKMWLGFLDETGAIIADPSEYFRGRLDVPEIDDAGSSCTITITYESLLVDLMRPRAWRYTDRDQRRIDPDDRGFRFVASIQEQPLVWRRSTAN